MSQYSEWTKHSYRVVIKRFWKWLSGDENYPSEVKWIKASCKQRNKIAIRPEDILTADEISAMVENCPTVRDKAMLLTLFESGMRPGELLTMRIKNVKFDEQGACISATGKTGDKGLLEVYGERPKTAQIKSLEPYLNSAIRKKQKQIAELANAGKLVQDTVYNLRPITIKYKDKYRVFEPKYLRRKRLI